MAEWLVANWREIVEVLTALLTPVVAATTVYIAWQQWRTNANRLRVELYDRRANVLRATGRHLALAMQYGNVTHEQTREFGVATAEAAFLFDHKIESWLNEISKRSIQITVRTETLKALPAGDQRRGEMNDRQLNDLKWMDEQLGALKQRFGKYLSVPH